MKKRLPILLMTVVLVLAALLVLPVKTAQAANISINATNFPDYTFRNYLKSQSWGADGVLTTSEIAGITSLNLSSAGDIRNLKGIEYFTSLTSLTCMNKDFSGSGTLDLSKNTALKTVDLGMNKLTGINVNGLTNLTKLSVYSNSLTSLDLSTNTGLIRLYVENNSLSSLDLSECINLKCLKCYNNSLTWLDITGQNFLGKYSNYVTPVTGEWEFEVGIQKTGHITLFGTTEQNKNFSGSEFFTDSSTYHNGGAGIASCTKKGLALSRVEEKDNTLYEILKGSDFDKDGDTYLSVAELTAVKELNLNASSVKDFSMLKYFPNLKSLYASSMTFRMTDATCPDFSWNPLMVNLTLNGHALTTIDLSGMPNLGLLCINDNELTELDVTANKNLRTLQCTGNALTSLNTANNTLLVQLNCGDNSLEELILPQTDTLTTVVCHGNDLTELTLNCPNLTELSTWGNKLRHLNLKNTKLFTEDKDYTSLGSQKNFTELFLLLTDAQAENYAIHGKDKYRNVATCVYELPEGLSWYVVNGWYETDVGRFYVENYVPSTGKFNLGSDWYYADDYGLVITGLFDIADVRYYADETGLLQKGWQYVNNTWYYFSKSTCDGLTGWRKISKKYYYLDPDNHGAMCTGWKKVGTKWYYLGTNGAMITGWKKIDSKWYYMNASGAMVTGWKQIGSKWYYFDKSGAMKTGWLKIGSTWYYLNKTSGAMKTGLATISGKTYYFDLKSGAMKKNYDIDGWHFDEKGVGTQVG